MATTPPLRVFAEITGGPAFSLKWDESFEVVPWGESTPIGPPIHVDFENLRQTDIPDMQICPYIQCSCESVFSYPSNVAEGEFSDFRCPDCQIDCTADQCRDVFERCVSESIAKAMNRSKQEGK